MYHSEVARHLKYCLEIKVKNDVLAESIESLDQEVLKQKGVNMHAEASHFLHWKFRDTGEGDDFDRYKEKRIKTDYHVTKAYDSQEVRQAVHDVEMAGALLEFTKTIS
ncbi:MAG: hypothetical protein ACRECH_15215 [Nitrososphaerales archaeon]